MSAIGEWSGFRKTAEELEKKLRDEGFGLSADERAKLVADIKWYHDEADFSRSCAIQEAMQDAYDDAHPRYDPLDDAETYIEDPETEVELD